MKYLQYLKYVLRHKWYVAWECAKRGLFWRGVVHDLSKLRFDELCPYTEYFYGARAKSRRDATGYYKVTDTGDTAFDFAWLLHQKRNRHHWQWWVLPEDSGAVKVLEIAYPYNLEMVCDWVGAGKAQGYSSPVGDPLKACRAWYGANKGKMQLHPATRVYVEHILSYMQAAS